MATWNQQQVEDWIAQQGGSDEVQYSEEQVEIDNPARDVNSDRYDPTEPKKISVSRQVWINKRTGAKLSVRQSPASSGYEVESVTGGNPQARTSASANETVSAPPTQQWVGSRKPDGTIDWTRNPNFKGPETPKPKVIESTHDDKTGVTSILVEHPDNTREWQKIEGGPVKTDEMTQAQKDTSQRGWAELALRTAQEQRLSAADQAKLRNGETVNLPNGRIIQIRNDPQTGEAIVTDVTPKNAGAVNVPDMTPGTALGTIYTGYNSALQKIMADQNMTPQEKLQAAEQVRKAAELLANETSYILTSQQNTLSNQTSQRNTDVQDAASRRTFASNLVDQSFKDVSGLAEYAPAGSGLAGPAFMGRILLGLQVADKLGGLQTFPRVEPGAAAQQVYGMPLPGTQAQPVQQPAQAAAPGVNITFNQTPQTPQFMEQATPVPPGMSFDGGQLRAPGYAPPPPDDQNPVGMPAFLSGLLG